jgi:hypothetical protein
MNRQGQERGERELGVSDCVWDLEKYDCISERAIVHSKVETINIFFLAVAGKPQRSWLISCLVVVVGTVYLYLSFLTQK